MTFSFTTPFVKMRLSHSAECDKCKIIKNLSAEYGQSEAETIPNRPMHKRPLHKMLCNGLLL